LSTAKNGGVENPIAQLPRTLPAEICPYTLPIDSKKAVGKNFFELPRNVLLL